LPRAKEIGKRERPAVIALVYTAKGEEQRTRMVINVFIREGKEEQKVKALIDSGAEANCIRQRLTQEMMIPPLGTRPTALMTPEGGRIHTYENH
jgi:hypothetical protein